MIKKIGLAQVDSSADWKGNIKKADRYAREAARQQVKLLLFSEYFMTYYPLRDGSYQEKGQKIDGEFVQEMRNIGKRYGIWMAFGMNEIGEEKGRSYNTIIVSDSEGNQRGFYRKAHLFDAYQWKESKQTIPGDQIFQPIDSPVGRLGIGTCYDLRFPELARLEALEGAEMMLYPSAWVSGEGKFMQWKVLLQARAIENEMYVFGCCHCGEHYMGRSLGFDPYGREILRGGLGEGLLVGEIELDQIDRARQENPVFTNRRKDLYQLSRIDTFH